MTRLAPRLLKGSGRWGVDSMCLLTVASYVPQTAFSSLVFSQKYCPGVPEGEIQFVPEETLKA